MQSQTFLLMVCALLLAVAVPLVFKLVPPNRIYGFRTATTLSRTDVWYRANIFTGWALIAAAALAATVILFMPQLSSAAHGVIVVGLMLCATAASFAYLKRIT